MTKEQFGNTYNLGECGAGKIKGDDLLSALPRGKQVCPSSKEHDLSSLRYFFLAGEPLDAPTWQWVSDALGMKAIDHYIR